MLLRQIEETDSERENDAAKDCATASKRNDDILSRSAMTPRGLISATHRAIRKYYEDLHTLQRQHVLHEMGLRSPFQRLLEETAKLKNWTLIAELSEKTSGGGFCSSSKRPPAIWRAYN